MTQKTIISVLSALMLSPYKDALSDLSINIDNCPENIAPFVVKLALDAPKESPKVDDLTLDVLGDDGKTQKLRPSAAERDEAWLFYQSALNGASKTFSTNKKTNASKEKKVAIKFLEPWEQYITGDVTTRPEALAESLIKDEVAERYQE